MAINHNRKEDQMDSTDFDVPGYNTPTGEVAAKGIVDSAASLRGRIYWHLRENGPMTSQEVAHRMRKPHNGVWQRMSELQRKGVVQYAGRNKKNTSGYPAKVWEIRTESGIDPDLLKKSKHSKEAMRNEIAKLKAEVKRLKAHLRLVHNCPDQDEPTTYISLP